MELVVPPIGLDEIEQVVDTGLEKARKLLGTLQISSTDKEEPTELKQMAQISFQMLLSLKAFTGVVRELAERMSSLSHELENLKSVNSR